MIQTWKLPRLSMRNASFYSTSGRKPVMVWKGVLGASTLSWRHQASANSDLIVLWAKNLSDKNSVQTMSKTVKTSMQWSNVDNARKCCRYLGDLSSKIHNWHRLLWSPLSRFWKNYYKIVQPTLYVSDIMLFSHFPKKFRISAPWKKTHIFLGLL